MNQRERVMASAVIGLLLLVGAAFLFYQLFLVPLQERDAAIQTVQQEIDMKQAQLLRAIADRSKLESLRELSLPPDVDLARREYQKYLSSILVRNGFEAGSFTVTSKDPPETRNRSGRRARKSEDTPLEFTVVAHANLESLVQMLEAFYHTALLHRIKSLSIQRPLTAGPQQRVGGLDINMTVEALIVDGADNRSRLLPNIDRRLLALDVLAALQKGPPGLGLAAWAAGPTGPLGPGTLARPQRHYAAIANKNVFFGPPQEKRKGRGVDVTRFVYLTDITLTNRGYEAFLYNRYNNRKTRLRNSTGFDTFRIDSDDGKTLVQGKVKRMDERDILFFAADKYYWLHVGQNIAEAMQKPLAPDEVESLTKMGPNGR